MILHKVSLLLLFYILSVECGYTITTPRRWTVEQPSQICVTVTEPPSGRDYIKVVFQTVDQPQHKNKNVKRISEEYHFDISPGKQSRCYELTLPKTTENNIEILIKANIHGKTTTYKHRIAVTSNNLKTFIQADKYLYKPGQNVQFRILSLKGPLMQISTENFAAIWVENPSASRIHQWKNVTNPEGLLHRSFVLSDEPDQGEYKINVLLDSGSTYSTTFKVEDYVLPRYEVTVTPPPYFLGTSKEVVFKICARYTFGQPVKGLLKFVVDNVGPSSYMISYNKTTKISGCIKMPIASAELKTNFGKHRSRSINVKATVIEEGTGVKLESDLLNVPIVRKALTFKDVRPQQYRKPGLPLVDEVLVEFPDGSPASNELMEVCIFNTCKTLSTNAKGILKYAIPPNTRGSIKVKSLAYPTIDGSTSYKIVMWKSETSRMQQDYHSPSNSSITIALDQKSLKCKAGKGVDIDLVVRYASLSQAKTIVHVQVISRGLIQYFSSFVQDLSKSTDFHIPKDLFIRPMNTTSDLVTGSFMVPITLPNSVSPKAEILVWYEREDKEVVSDHISVDIERCLPSNVKLQWSVDLARPGDEANLVIDAEPMSLCSLGVVDKSVELLSSNHNSLTIDKILMLAEESSVSSQENLQVDNYQYCIDKLDGTDIPRPSRHFTPRSTSADAITMFSDAGVFVFSDLTLETRPCTGWIGDPGWGRGRIAYSSRGSSFGPVSSGPSTPEESTPPAQISSPRVYFPETWLWKISVLPETGILQIPLVLPDTITEWVGKAVCVHHTKGVGLSEAATVTTFKDFFVDLTLPPTAKRGEIFPVKISIFNYLKEQLPVTVNLLDGPLQDYDVLSENNEERGTGLRSACVEPEGKTVFSIRIIPRNIGQMNITVDAMIDINSIQCGGTNREERRDVIVKPVKVDYEGFPKEKTWNEYVCIKDYKEITDNWKIEAPPGIVEDSARGWLSVVSDLMGPTIENLGQLVRMPYGCGEQNMLNFAPNIFVLQYLEAANEKTEELAAKSIEYMEKGYQRELNYRHTDGSFSAFGSSDDSGSTWLTAFVLKSFHKAQQFINIDQADLAMSADWLKSKQLKNGCFEKVGKVLHKSMKGGVSGNETPSLLSTYVLLSLLEGGEDPNSKVVRKAQLCLEADNTVDPYALALRLYAYALAKSPEAQPTAKALLSLATQTKGTLSWDMKNDEKKSKSAEVEIASYAVLALLTLDSVEYADVVHLIIKWINQQRNAQGGFISTQDTILALQAMALYETVLPSEEPDAKVFYTVGSREKLFNVHPGNKLLLQKINIPTIPATVAVKVTGRGCVLVQGVLRYNVLEGDTNAAFGLSVTTKTPYDLSCKTKEITVCASYLLSDLTSNMAIIEVNLVSGYIPDKEDLKQIVANETSLFKRYEVDGSAVMFYLDEITDEELCATFKIIREVDVENVKPGTVKVYDYYKPENVVSQKYELPDTTECNETEPELPVDMAINDASSKTDEYSEY